MGQYGNIEKIVLNSQVFLVNNEEQHSVYITYHHQKDAALAILALQDFKLNDNILKASFGTSKYCSYFIRNTTCIN